MSRDSTKQQIYEACDRIKSAAEIMGFLMYVSRMRKKEHPDDAADSPRLMITISVARLMEKTDYSRRQVQRALKILVNRGFIIAHFSEGESNQYQVNEGAIERWVQPMELFDQDESCHPCHDDTPRGVTMTPPPASPWHPPLRHHDAGPPYSASNTASNTSIIKEPADAEVIQQPEEETAQAVLSPDAQPGRGSPDEAPDADRDELIHQCQAIGISKEHAEAHLTDHSRQKLKAALVCLAIDKRSRRIRSEAGYVIGFLRDPTKYGYELDPQGCWRSSREIAVQRRRSARPRDRPDLSTAQARRHAAAVAWDQLSYANQQQIRSEIEATHPTEPHALRLQRCHEAALSRQQQEPAP